MDFFRRFEKLGAVPRFSNTAVRLRRSVLAMLACCFLLAAPTFAQERAPQQPQGPEAVHYGWADVLRVDPVYEPGAASEPQQECYEEQVLQQPGQASVPDQGKRVGNTVIGAIFGSIIGSRIGKGDGRKAATAAGAIAGGVIGNNVGANSNQLAAEAPRYITQRHCRQVEGSQRRVLGFDVEYRYRGEVYTARMASDPGDRMRVRVTVTPAE